MEDKQVIVVERSPMWRGREMAILDGAGYRTDAFPTYADAHERLLQDQTLRGAVLGYDIGSTSGEDGLVVLSRIRSTSRLPVIICAEPFQGCSFVSVFGKAFYIDRTVPAEYFGEALRNSALGLFGVPKTVLKKEKPTILVAEDEQAQRRIEATILTGMGYVVVEAKNGEEARAALYDRDDIDGFSTDNEMGQGPSGLDLLTFLRGQTDHRLRGLSVLVACSDPDTKGNPIDLETIRRYGAEFLPKPFFADEYSAAADRTFGLFKQPKS